MSNCNVFSKQLIVIYFLISLSVFQSGVDFQMSLFMYYPPKHVCQSTNVSGVTVSDDNCRYIINDTATVTEHRCQRWTFDQTQIDSTVVTDFGLVCQYRYLQLLLLPIRQISSIFNLVLAFLSDIKGRRNIFLITLFLDSVLWILVGVIPNNYISHVTLRSLKSAVSASPIIGFVLLSEITPTKYRNIVSINYWVPFSLGIAVAPLYVWITRAWLSAWLLSSIPNLLFLAAPFVILESPYWLKANNRESEASEVCTKLHLNLFNDEHAEEKPGNEDSHFCADLKEMLVSCKIVTRILVLLFTSFVFYFVYQGISTDFSFATANIYINAIALGLVEIPAGPISSFVSSRYGNVNSTVVGLLLTLMCYSVYAGLQSSVQTDTVSSITAQIVLACLVRFLITATWNVQGVYYITLIPTTVRNFFNNFGEIFGKFGSGFGGFLGYYVAGQYSTATIVYCVMLLASMILIGLVIPQIELRNLPQTAEEAKKIEKDFPCGTIKKDF